ncbi:MAG TPA: hypothetical protein PLS55_00945 [Thermogutta sp.]|nr:hypothetical protein [Thermogutta sp.]
MKFTYSLIVLLSFALVAIVGCGKGTDPNRPKTVKAGGVVLYNGQPVEGAVVTLVPMDNSSPRGAVGQTDAQGRFSLTSFDPNDGAVPGKYYVGIAKVVLEDAPPGQTGPGGEQDPEAKVARDLLPLKYKIPQQSGLTAEITASGPNELKFELTD